MLHHTHSNTVDHHYYGTDSPPPGLGAGNVRGESNHYSVVCIIKLVATYRSHMSHIPTKATYTIGLLFVRTYTIGNFRACLAQITSITEPSLKATLRNVPTLVDGGGSLPGILVGKFVCLFVMRIENSLIFTHY